MTYIGLHRDPLERRRGRREDPNPEIWGNLDKVHKTNIYTQTTIEMSAVTEDIPIVRSHRDASRWKKIWSRLSSSKKG